MVSIIIPVYNVARYLRQCVRSVATQDLRDIEIILVNDASTDNSLDVCKELACRDSRIKVVNKPVNEGIDMARYTGLGHISKDSKYVTFIDSDDWFTPGILSRCYSVAEESRADYVQMCMQRVFDRWAIMKRKCRNQIVSDTATAHDNYITISQPQLFEDYFLSFFGTNILSVNVCGKFYRRSLFDRANIAPSRLRWGEDLIMNMWLFPYLEKIALIDDIGYNYRVGGATSHYLSQLIPAATRMFYFKEQAIERFNYDKATYPTRVEMKNILRSDICQRIAWRVGTQESNVREIEAILVDPLWDRVGELAQDSRHADDAFVQALGRKDAKTLYEVCASFTKPYGLKRKLQETILKIIS